MTTTIRSYDRTVIIESADQILELIANEDEHDAYETARLILETIGGSAAAVLASKPLTSGDDDHFDYTPALIDLIHDTYAAANLDNQGVHRDGEHVETYTAIKYVRLLALCEPQSFDELTATFADPTCTHVRALDAHIPAFDDLVKHTYETCPIVNDEPSVRPFR